MAELKITDLKEATYNPRTISDKRLAQLQKSIQQFGDLSGVVFNERTKTLVSGHQRLKTIGKAKTRIETKPHTDEFGTIKLGYIYAKSAAGEVAIPLRIVDWTSKQTEMAANIAANAHGGEFDKGKLKVVMDKLEKSQFDIELTGLEASDLRSIRNFEEKHAVEEDEDSDDDYEDEDDEIENPKKKKEQPKPKELEGDFQILVTAKNEKHLNELFAEFNKRKLKCKVLS